jgi:hypothetical protein
VIASTRLRTSLTFAAALAAAAGVAGLVGRAPEAVVRPAAAAPVPVELPDTLGFQVSYQGLGAEGVDLVWRGATRGPLPAQVTIRVEYAGSPAGRNRPVWPVNAWLFYSADDLRASFAAELSGSMDWRSGELRVTGLVSDGARAGIPLEQRMQVRSPELSGRVRIVFLSHVALGGRPAR